MTDNEKLHQRLDELQKEVGALRTAAEQSKLQAEVHRGEIVAIKTQMLDDASLYSGLKKRVRTVAIVAFIVGLVPGAAMWAISKVNHDALTTKAEQAATKAAKAAEEVEGSVDKIKKMTGQIETLEGKIGRTATVVDDIERRHQAADVALGKTSEAILELQKHMTPDGILHVAGVEADVVKSTRIELAERLVIGGASITSTDVSTNAFDAKAPIKKGVLIENVVIQTAAFFDPEGKGTKQSALLAVIGNPKVKKLDDKVPEGRSWSFCLRGYSPAPSVDHFFHTSYSEVK